MTNYREILRLKKLGLNNSQIAQSLGCSRTTVIQVLSVAEEKGISYPLPEDLSDRKLSELLFPSDRSKPEYKMPDYEYVHRELQKNGVTLNLLWLEYCEKCREASELPYQLTQFKKHYRDYAIKTNATMHLNHKPGEIMQVDWAGDTATIIDTDTGEAIPTYVFVSSLPYSGLIIRNRIYTYLKKEQERSETKQNFLTVSAALRELEKIELIKMWDKEYRLDYAITATQRKNLNAFDLTPTNSRDQAKALSIELKTLDEVGQPRYTDMRS